MSTEREDELERQVDELRSEKREQEQSWRNKVDTHMEFQSKTLGEIKMSQERHHAGTSQEIAAVKVEVDTLKEVVCGSPGNEDVGMSVRLRKVETHIVDAREKRSRGFWLAAGALVTSLVAMSKDYIAKKMVGGP